MAHRVLPLMTQYEEPRPPQFLHVPDISVHLTWYYTSLMGNLEQDMDTERISCCQVQVLMWLAGILHGTFGSTVSLHPLIQCSPFLVTVD